MIFLLDTHMLLWWHAEDPRLSKQARSVIEGASPQAPLWLSEISLLEVATLHRLGRIRLDLALRTWLERAAAPPLVRCCGISPAIAAETSALPPGFPADPADRIIAATARVVGATLLTADAAIIASGAVPTLT